LNGRGYFKLIKTDEGRFRIEGEWGYGDDEVGGGPWFANQIRGAEPDNCYASVRKAASTSGGSDPFGDDAEESEHADF
jgi:hypothetical protein